MDTHNTHGITKAARECCATEGWCDDDECRQGDNCPARLTSAPEPMWLKIASNIFLVIFVALFFIVIGGPFVAHFYQGN